MRKMGDLEKQTAIFATLVVLVCTCWFITCFYFILQQRISPEGYVSVDLADLQRNISQYENKKIQTTGNVGAALVVLTAGDSNADSIEVYVNTNACLPLSFPLDENIVVWGTVRKMPEGYPVEYCIVADKWIRA